MNLKNNIYNRIVSNKGVQSRNRQDNDSHNIKDRIVSHKKQHQKRIVLSKGEKNRGQVANKTESKDTRRYVVETVPVPYRGAREYTNDRNHLPQKGRNEPQGHSASLVTGKNQGVTATGNEKKNEKESSEAVAENGENYMVVINNLPDEFKDHRQLLALLPTTLETTGAKVSVHTNSDK